MNTVIQRVSQGIRNALGFRVATARALQPKATTRTVRVVTNEGKNQMANAIRKRIALAAAVALAGGLLSAVPAQAAAVDASNTLPLAVTAAEYAADADGTPIAVSDSNVKTDKTVSVSHNAASVNNFIQLTVGTAVTDTVSTSGVRVDVSGSTIISSRNSVDTATVGTINSTSTSVAFLNTTFVAGTDIKFSTAKAGTFTITVTAIDTTTVAGSLKETVRQTFNVTVAAAASKGVANAANTKIIAAETNTVADTATDTTVVGDNDGGANLSTGLWAVVYVKDGFKSAVTGETVTATLSSGAGLLKASSVTAKTVVDAVDSNGKAEFEIVSDGTNVGGNATITFSIGTTTLGTKTVKLYGKTAKLVATVSEPHITKSTAGETVTVVTATDAAGNPVANDSLSVTSGTTAAATVASASVPTSAKGEASIVMSGVAAGKTTVTVKSSSDSTVSTTFDIVVTDDVIASLVLTSNKATYAPGEKMTLTFTAKDKDGTLMGKKQFTSLFQSAMTASAAGVTGTLFTETITVSAGVATVDVFAPLAAGTLTFSTKTSKTSASLATAEQDVTKSVTVTIAAAANADIAQIKADLALLQKETMDLIAKLSAQISYLRKQLNQLLRRR